MRLCAKLLPQLPKSFALFLLMCLPPSTRCIVSGESTHCSLARKQQTATPASKGDHVTQQDRWRSFWMLSQMRLRSQTAQPRHGSF